MDLAALIDTQRGGRTYAQLEKDTGGSLGAARWQQMATRGLRNFPTPQSLRAVARALHVSDETVLLAAGTSLGLRIDQRHSLIELIPPHATDLSDQCVTAILAVVRAMCATQGIG